jgi:hypothetical protein
MSLRGEGGSTAIMFNYVPFLQLLFHSIYKVLTRSVCQVFTKDLSQNAQGTFLAIITGTNMLSVLLFRSLFTAVYKFPFQAKVMNI